jgi:hypothetical protein
MDEGPEADHVSGRAIVRVGLVVFIVLLALLAGLALLADYYSDSHPAHVDVYPIPSKPRIDAAPHLELDRYLSEQRARLESYAWVDRRRGLVHIPIERALALYAKNAQNGGAR